MSSTPTVSIVVPTYNAEGFIAETLGSVLGQDMSDLELVVVDDGSTDRTCEVVRGLGDARIRLFTQANRGRCVARNKGLELSRAPFVCFLDHDDVWHPRKLSAQLRVFAAEPDTALVHTDYIVWRADESGRFATAASLLPENPGDELDSVNSGWAYHHLLVNSFVLTSTAMMRTEAVRAVGAFDPTLPYSEDWDLWFRLSRQWPFSKLKGRFALYRQLPTQGSRVYREVDYRMRLLEAAVEKWGIASPNGESFGWPLIRRQFSAFRAGYGLECLRAGDVTRARQSLWRAWVGDPRHVKYLAYLLAGQLGWRPPW